MHCVARQNKLETPKEKDEVNKREVHECDVWTRDPDEMVVPPTPKPTYKAEALADHRLKLWRKRCAEEVAFATVVL